jgi:hypothetical protein
MIHITDQDLTVDVLALQVLPAPELFEDGLAALGGRSCAVIATVGCCNRTVCQNTI